ncbi:hypothetical protein, partial [Kribbella aluminosa]|uniref:hypothetical protein n=1 Tax=Kribbella aluminosa TaxID=416017 RepID=UPI0031E2CDBB
AAYQLPSLPDGDPITLIRTCTSVARAARLAGSARSRQQANTSCRAAHAGDDSSLFSHPQRLYDPRSRRLRT